MKIVYFALLGCTILNAQEIPDSWAQLPMSFKAQNIIEVYKGLNIKRGEFENIEAFEARQEKSIPANGKTFFFLCSNIPFGISYDADDQEFSFRALGGNETGFVVSSKLVKGNDYLGTNAFGVKKMIHNLTEFAYVVKPWSASFRDEQILFKIPCKVAIAPKVKNDFGVILVVQTPNNIWPVVDPDDYHLGATIDSPVNYTKHSYTMIMNLQKVVVYRRSNRAILYNQNPLQEQ